MQGKPKKGIRSTAPQGIAEMQRQVVDAKPPVVLGLSKVVVSLPRTALLDIRAVTRPCVEVTLLGGPQRKPYASVVPPRAPARTAFLRTVCPIDVGDDPRNGCPASLPKATRRPDMDIGKGAERAARPCDSARQGDTRTAAHSPVVDTCRVVARR